MSKNMIIITGATGFIGSAIFEALSKSDDRIVLCDWLGSQDKWKNIAKHDFEDFVYPEALPDFLEKNAAYIKAIIHMGAISETTETDVDYIFDNNYKLSANLLAFCLAENVQMIYASSAATYGDGSQGFSDVSIDALKPLNPYGWSKHIFDKRVLKQLSRSKNAPQITGLKFFNVYGPNEYHKGGQTSVAYQLLDQIRTQKKVTLFKAHAIHGSPRRDFIYVKDCISVVKWFLGHPDTKYSGVYNVGTGIARSFEDMAKSCFKALDIPENIKHIDMPEHLIGKYQYFTQADTNKLNGAGRELTKSFHALEKGIEDYYQNYLMTQDPYL